MKVNQSISHTITTNMGVPQCSILGPLLFILYIDDLLDLLQELMAYADDTISPLHGSNWIMLAIQLSQKLDIIYSWLYQNHLTPNVSKSTYITFGNYKDSVPRAIEVTINNQIVERSESSKYLGITYDSNMKWDVHINKIVKRTKYLVFIFYRLKSALSRKHFFKFTMVCSIALQYMVS